MNTTLLRDGAEGVLFFLLAAALHLILAWQLLGDSGQSAGGLGGKASATIIGGGMQARELIAAWESQPATPDTPPAPAPLPPMDMADTVENTPLPAPLEPDPIPPANAPAPPPTLSAPVVDRTPALPEIAQKSPPPPVEEPRPNAPPPRARPRNIAAAQEIRPDKTDREKRPGAQPQKPATKQAARTEQSPNTQNPTAHSRTQDKPANKAQAGPSEGQASVAAGTGGAPAGTHSGQAQTDTGQNSANAASLTQLWGAKIQRAVERHKKPARGRQRAGTVMLSLSIAHSGALIAVKVKKSSGFRALDQAAIKAVKASNPFAPAPKNLAGERHEFSLPVVFEY